MPDKANNNDDVEKMASYYSLIAKAVAGLDPDATGESRRAIYERASAALLAQLSSINPPFTEAEITRERLALEEAVRKVEEEAAQQAHDARIRTFSDLVTDIADLGKATAEANRRYHVLKENLFGIDRMPLMTVNGRATGRLNRIWRWRIRVPR
jgi:hypothetical protein